MIDAEARAFLRRHYAPEIAAIKYRHARRRWLGRGGMVLAMGLAAAMVGIVVTAGQTVTAPSPGPMVRELADGTRVHLDAGAVLEIPLAPWRRHVRLEKGEALFEVAHDESRSFTVTAGDMVIRDIGTRFLVRNSAASISVAVFEGAVELSDPDGKTLPLAAGHAVSGADGHMAFVPMPDEAEATAWRQGRMIFRDAPLAEVAECLSRYGGVPVILSGSGLAGLRVNGVFRTNDVPGALATVQRALPIRLSHADGAIVLSPASASGH